MIELITGVPGAGKSYYSVRFIVRSVKKGRVVVTNVPLREDWAQQLAAAGWHKWRNPEHVARRRERYENLVYITDDFDDMLRVRVEGEGEGRADMVVDECQRWLDSRTWDQAVGMTKDEAIVHRKKRLDFFSAHRHHGYNVYLLTQDARNIDARIQRLYEYIVYLKNLKRVKVLGVPIFPVNLFVANRCWNDKFHTRVSVNTFGLEKSIANLYSTHALKVIDHPDDVVWMPRRPGAVVGPGDRPQPPEAAEGGRPAQARAGAAGATPLRPGELPVPSIAGIPEERS